MVAALLQILFSLVLWVGADRVTPTGTSVGADRVTPTGTPVGADRVTPPCAWPPPRGFLALILA